MLFRSDTGIIVNNVLITQANEYLKYIGKTTLTVRNGKVVERKNELINLSKLRDEDESIKALIAKYHDESPMNEIIGEAGKQFDGKEALGNLIGHLIEVTADKKIAWEFVSPLFAGEAKCVVTDEKDSTSHNFNTNSMHRAYRYGRDFPGLQGKDLSVKRPLADGCPLFYKVYKKGASFEGSFEKIDEGNKNEGDEELMMPAY